MEKKISELAIDTLPSKTFKDDIALWVLLDNQIKVIYEKTKKLRNMKQSASERICKYLTENDFTPFYISNADFFI